MRNAVVFGDYSIDRSPCGTGTSAKVSTLYHEGKLKLGEPFRYESFIGSVSTGVAKEEAQVGIQGSRPYDNWILPFNWVRNLSY